LSTKTKQTRHVSAYVSEQSQLRIRRLCWNNVLLPTCQFATRPCWRQVAFSEEGDINVDMKVLVRHKRMHRFGS